MIKRTACSLITSFFLLGVTITATRGELREISQETDTVPKGNASSGIDSELPRLGTVLVAENPLHLSKAQLDDVEERISEYQSVMKLRWDAVERERQSLRAALLEGAPDGKRVVRAWNNLTDTFSGMLEERKRLDTSLHALLNHEQMKYARVLFNQVDGFVYASCESGRHPVEGARDRLSALLAITREQRDILGRIVASNRESLTPARSLMVNPLSSPGAGSDAAQVRNRARAEAELVVVTEQGISRIFRLLNRDQRNRAWQAQGELEACVREGLLGSGS